MDATTKVFLGDKVKHLLDQMAPKDQIKVALRPFGHFHSRTLRLIQKWESDDIEKYLEKNMA